MMNNTVTMQKAKDFLLHLFLPNTCMFCRKPVAYDKTLCEACAEEASLTPTGQCLIRLHSPCTCEETALSQLISPFYYEMGANNAVQDLKFHNNRLNARKLAIYMADRIGQNPIARTAEGLIPVPLYHKDFRKRGYNQAVLLAKHISERIQIPIFDTVLIKAKPTKKQHELSSKERLTNLQGAFQLQNASLIQNKTLLLIDDVYTTGSTMTTCAQALLQGGASCVIGVTATKTRYREDRKIAQEEMSDGNTF